MTREERHALAARVRLGETPDPTLSSRATYCRWWTQESVVDRPNVPPCSWYNAVLGVPILFWTIGREVGYVGQWEDGTLYRYEQYNKAGSWDALFLAYLEKD